MKKYKLLIVLFVLLASNSLGARAAIRQDSIIQTITYDPNKLYINYDTIVGNQHYVFVKYGDIILNEITNLSTNNRILPIDNLVFSVPYNATNFTVQDSIKSVNLYLKNNHLYPRDLYALTDSTLSLSSIPDELYSILSFQPLNPCQLHSSGYVLGDNKIITLKLMPVTYDPSLGILRLATVQKIKIYYDIDDSIIPPIIRYDLDTKVDDLAKIEPNVVNGTSMMANSFLLSGNTITYPEISQYSLPTYSYCIITNRELAPAFKKIIAMKRQKGLSAGIVCIEDIMASPDYNLGDIQGGTYPNITDTAGVVRQYLKYAFQSSNNPTQYVLMGGKAPLSPVRYTHTFAETDIDNSHVSTDMYFSNLSLPWVHNSSTFDQQFENEYMIIDTIKTKRNLPLFPDLFVGRLLCTTNDDIDNYSNKLYKYIFNPGNGNSSYLSKATFENVGNLFDDFLVRNLAKKYFGDNDYSYINNSLEKLNGSQFIDYLNINKQNFVSINAHGDTQSIKILASSSDNLSAVLTALDNYPVQSWIQVEHGNGLDCLTNKNEPFILYTLSCSTMPYDKALNIEGSTTTHGKYNFGESFTLGKNYGGPAYLGNTRSSFFESSILEGEFLRALFRRKMYSLGMAEAFSKLFHIKGYGSNIEYQYNHVNLTHNLLGDPEFEMWTCEPQRYEGIVVSQSINYVFIDGVTSSDTIAYCDNDGNIGKTIGSDSFSLIVPSPSTSIMIYNHDHIPYIAPLKLQNCNINNSQYVYASSFSAGRNVLPSVIGGNVTIKNGAVYEVEATDDVHLGKGFIVENGATFAIKTPGKVTIDGCVFHCGAKVKIEAGKVEIVKSFTAELGSMVKITQYVD